MEQKLLIRLLEQIYILNDMKGKNRAALKMNTKAIYIAIYSNFFDDLDISETIQITFGRYKTNNDLKEAYSTILNYISNNL